MVATRKKRPVIRLLPPVCRDCGKSEKEGPLSPYLDFHLCIPCIRRREQEVMRMDAPGRAAPAREAVAQKAAKKKPAKAAVKARKSTKKR